MIRNSFAIRETPSFQKGHIFVGYGFSELIQESRFAHPGFSHNGDGLAPVNLSPLKTIEQKL
jgi:hypothetical protein